MDKYDVFISCKSEDYRYAEEVYDFLTENHIHTFLASRELRKLGDSEYREAIEEALDVAEHMIVLSSKPEYVKSKWVKYEWGLFLNDKIDGHKTGNILTILLGFEPHSLGIALRKYESFRFESYKENLLNYVETNESKARLKEIKIQRELEEKQRREEEYEKQRKERLRKELIFLAEEYKKKETNLSIDIAKIRLILKSLNVITKKCPICSNVVPLDNDYCEKCGWLFYPLEGIRDADYLLDNNVEAIATHKKIYEACNNVQRVDAEIKIKNFKISQLQKDLDERSAFVYNLREQIDSLTYHLDNLNEELVSSQEEIESLRQKGEQTDTTISQLLIDARDNKSQIEELMDKNKVLSHNIKSKDIEIENLKKKLKEYRDSASQDYTPSTKSILATPGMGIGLGTIDAIGFEASKIGNNIHQRNFKEEEYKVIVTFCPKDAIEVIKEYDGSFSLPRNSNGTYQSKINKVVAGFDAMQEAEQLKKQLEYKGATVIIKRNSQVVSPAPKSSTAKKRAKDSSRLRITRSKSNTSISSSSNITSTFGVRIKHCGINKAKVAQMLSRVYGKSTNSFKLSLDNLPFDTTPNLSRKEAEDLLIKLGQIGATVDLYNS